MNRYKSSKSYNLGIICPSDFIYGVRGGAAGFISNIMNDFTAEKITIFGVSMSDNSPWEGKSINEKVKFIPICKIKYPSKIPMRLKVLIYYFIFRKKILENHIDLLYIHMPECCLPFIFFKKVPVIYHQHGSANPVALSKYNYARTSFFQNLFEFILRLIYRNADWIIAIDRFCYIKAINNGAGKTTTLLRNAIDIKRYKPNDILRKAGRQEHGIIQGQYVILFVGRIEKTKGVLHLLKCVAQLDSKKLKFHIFFAGDGSFLPFAKNYVKDNRFDNYVTFLGRVDHEKLSLYYNMADVMVLPSDMEGIPMVILESLSCGTPVVASRVGGIPDIVDHGHNGFLVDDLSPENLTNMILKALKMNKERKAISTSVHRFSASEYMIHFDHIIDKLLYTL